MIAYRLLGYRRVRADASNATAVLNVCRECGFVYDRFCGNEDGSVSLCMRLHPAKKLEEICRGRNISVEIGPPCGLVAYAYRYRMRVGLAVGVLLAVALTVYASLFVWDVRISGNETVTDHEIRRSLQACGFGVGSTRIGFQADHVENRVLMADDRIAWISINMKGTVAYVQIREAVEREPEPDTGPCNVIAARSGIVQWIELEGGNVLVAAGQSVNEGELLVSGLYDSDRVGMRWTHASAKVYARTVREVHVEIPMSYEQKVYGGREGAKDLSEAFVAEKSVIFFGKEIKFSKKTGNMVGSCDTIKKSKAIGRIGDVALPISYQTVWYMPYTFETVTRTPEEAAELAYLELARQIGELPGDAELIRKTVSTGLRDDVFFLDCVLVSIEDIALERPFDVVE